MSDMCSHSMIFCNVKSLTSATTGDCSFQDALIFLIFFWGGGLLYKKGLYTPQNKLLYVKPLNNCTNKAKDQNKTAFD